MDEEEEPVLLEDEGAVSEAQQQWGTAQGAEAGASGQGGPEASPAEIESLRALLQERCGPARNRTVALLCPGCMPHTAVVRIHQAELQSCTTATPTIRR